MRLRDYFLLAACGLGFCAVILTLSLVGTPEVGSWIALAARRALESSAVGLLLCGAAMLFLLSLCAAAWDRAERRWERANRERAEEQARRHESTPLLWTPTQGQDLTRVLFPGDASSLLDDTPGEPLPERFRAPCGEPLRFPSTNDSGPKAA